MKFLIQLLELLFWFSLLTGCTNPNKDSGPCVGNSGNTLSCSSGSCSHSGGTGCSAPVDGVYCCNGKSGGSNGGTVMGCYPATGCGTWWLNICDQLCYSNSSGGVPCSTHVQCY